MQRLYAHGCSAWLDWWSGTRNVQLWWTLAWYDIVLRYRRSMLGPLWLTISMGAMLIGMGPLYSTLFNVPINKFFPHLTLGIITWQFFTSSISDGCQVFISAAPYLKQSQFSRSIFVWRSLARQAIQFAHHMILYLPVAEWAGIRFSTNLFFVVPGMLVVLVNLHAISIVLGIVCARFRDVAQIVASILQLLMFMTPVFWFPENLPARAQVVLMNPLAQMMEVIRLPLLGAAPAPGTWWFLTILTAVDVTLAAILYSRFRKQLVFWI